MRIKISCFTHIPLNVPRNYQHILQGIIYSNLGLDVAKQLHNHDSFKNFCFSNIQGDFITEEDGSITLLNSFHFYVSSSSLVLMSTLINNLSNNDFIRVLSVPVSIVSIDQVIPKINSNSVKINMISPVTIYTTENKKTFYYSPSNPKFIEYINSNFLNKIGDTSGNTRLSLSNFTNVKKIVCKYKGFIIEAYKFKATLNGNIDDLILAYDLGLGGKNSQGFGMFEII